MLVAPQTSNRRSRARRLERWGAQTCTMADIALPKALLPERSWHAILIDRALGTAEVERLAETAIPHAARRIVTFTPAMRHESRAIIHRLYRLSGQAAARDVAGSPPDPAGNPRAGTGRRRRGVRTGARAIRNTRSQAAAKIVGAGGGKTTRSTRS